MYRCRITLALAALGAILALGAAACSSVQRGSEMDPTVALTNLLSGSAEKASAAEKSNFFSTRGNKIVDADGNEVTITGVNWFGMETGTYAPHGLWSRNWEEMLDQIADLGFNTLRLPYSNQLFDPGSKTGEGVDFKFNPDLKGLTGIEVMDKIITGAGKRGLKVILDRHRPDTKAQSKLWYTAKYPEERWIADWLMLAERYKGNDTVIGADLHNEPAGDSTWGTGDPKTDWRLAAEKAGNAILDVNPDWLIIVEGIEKTDNNKKWYWMGGNLIDAAKHPIRLKSPDKLVYSAHDYGPEVYLQGWFKEASFPANLPEVWDTHWAYLAKEGKAPVLMGEFGGRSVGDSKEDKAGAWQRTLVQFLKERGLSYTYWCINPNSGDTGGILDEDWKTVHEDKMALLSTYMEPKMRIARASQVNTSVGPKQVASAKPDAPPIPEGKAAPDPGSNDPKVQVLFEPGKTDVQTNNPGFKIKLVNVGTIPVKLGDLEIRYWFNPDNEDGKKQVLDVDWASVGNDGVESRFEKAGAELDYLGLMFKDRNKELAPESAVELVLRIHKEDWSAYDQSNDYSFSADSAGDEWKRITAYVGKSLRWGVEPKLK